MGEIEFNTIDEYIALFPKHIQEIMHKVRAVVNETAPEAIEKISWGMATFSLHGNLVHFAGNKNHLGFYPGPSGVEKYKDELIGYSSSKGAIQFPYDKEIPYDLIRKIVEFRVEENKMDAINKLKKKKE